MALVKEIKENENNSDIKGIFIILTVVTVSELCGS